MQSRRNSQHPPDQPIASIPSFEATGDDWVGDDRRDSDRRVRPTRPWGGGPRSRARRAQGRRATDQSGYVDRYSRRDVLLILTVFLMNVCDAFFTMLWLERGGGEANPVMHFLLDIGPGAFLIQKCLVVGFWLVILLVHKNFRFARIGLYASLAVYATLLITHFAIIAFDIQPVPEEPGLIFHESRIPDPRFSIPIPGGRDLALDLRLNRRADPPASE